MALVLIVALAPIGLGFCAIGQINGVSSGSTSEINAVITTIDPGYEDFVNDYTEVDIPANRITVNSATNVSVTNVDIDEVCYLYRDMGVNHFSGNFEHLIDVKAVSSAETSGDRYAQWAMTNALGAAELSDQFYLMWVDDGVAGKVKFSIVEFVGGAGWSDTSALRDYGTIYYFEIERDEGVGVNGTLDARIYSDAARTILLETLSLALHNQADYRYVMAAQSVDLSLGGRAATGSEAFLDLQETADNIDNINAAPW